MAAQSFILNLEFNDINFVETNRTLITNFGITANGIQGTAQVSVHRYDNLIVKYRVCLSAYLTLLMLSNA